MSSAASAPEHAIRRARAATLIATAEYAVVEVEDELEQARQLEHVILAQLSGLTSGGVLVAAFASTRRLPEPFLLHSPISGRQRTYDPDHLAGHSCRTPTRLSSLSAPRPAQRRPAASSLGRPAPPSSDCSRHARLPGSSRGERAARRSTPASPGIAHCSMRGRRRRPSP